MAAAELLNANGNLGPALLAPGAMAGVNAVLDQFLHLGIKGVTVEICFPMLLPSFPNSLGYLSFYAQVAAAVRQRHMILAVEENPAFPGFTSLETDYSGLTLQGYATQQAAEAQLIIDDLQPTYLTLLDETDTFAAHLKLPLNNPTNATAVLNAELFAIKRGQTKLGAGTGTWEGPTIDQSLLTNTSIDYLSVHVYPVDSQSLDNLDAIVAAAAAAHRPVVMDETWLYKQQAPGIAAGAAFEQTSTLDNYSFFAPLDQAFLQAMFVYARSHGVAYISPFWTGFFFAYLKWAPELDSQAPSAIRAQGSGAWSMAVRDGQFSTTGEAYGRLAALK